MKRFGKAIANIVAYAFFIGLVAFAIVLWVGAFTLDRHPPGLYWDYDHAAYVCDNETKPFYPECANYDPEYRGPNAAEEWSAKLWHDAIDKARRDGTTEPPRSAF